MHSVFFFFRIANYNTGTVVGTDKNVFKRFSRHLKNPN